MADPFTLAAVGALVLSEGVKFLFGQAGELIKRWRDKKDAAKEPAAPAVQRIELALPPAFGGGTLRADVDLDAVGPASARLLELRAALSNYVDGVSEVTTADRALLRTTEDLRGVMETLLGQRLTLAGENRPATGTPVVRSEVNVGTVEGKVTGVAADEVTGGQIESKTTAQEVKEGGDVTGVRIGKLGPPPSRQD
jgi:hypothetical protein